MTHARKDSYSTIEKQLAEEKAKTQQLAEENHRLKLENEWYQLKAINRKLLRANKKLKSDTSMFKTLQQFSSEKNHDLKAAYQVLDDQNKILKFSPPCSRFLIPLNLITDLNLGKEVSSGTYASVYKANYQGKAVAIKELSKSGNRVILQEFDISSVLHHPNINNFYGVAMSERGIPLLVYEWIEYGSVLDCLDSKTKNKDVKNYLLSLLNLLLFLHGISEGLHYLHTKLGIIHRDIAARNVLVNKELKPVICDFGISLFGLPTNKPKQGWDEPESKAHEAPESLLRFAPQWSFACDSWSFGMMTMEILHLLENKRYRPYGDHPDPYDHVMCGKFPPAVTDEMVKNPLLRILIKKCLAFKPDDRPNMSDIKEALCFIFLYDWLSQLGTASKHLILGYTSYNPKLFSYSDSWIDKPPKEFWGHDKSVMEKTTRTTFEMKK